MQQSFEIKVLLLLKLLCRWVRYVSTSIWLAFTLDRYHFSTVHNYIASFAKSIKFKHFTWLERFWARFRTLAATADIGSAWPLIIWCLLMATTFYLLSDERDRWLFIVSCCICAPHKYENVCVYECKYAQSAVLQRFILNK